MAGIAVENMAIGCGVAGLRPQHVEHVLGAPSAALEVGDHLDGLFRVGTSPVSMKYQNPSTNGYSLPKYPGSDKMALYAGGGLGQTIRIGISNYLHWIFLFEKESHQFVYTYSNLMF